MSEQYAQQWRSYRRRHWAASLGLLLGLPAACLVGYLMFAVTDLALGIALTVSGVGWSCIWLWLCFRVTRFPCPGCSQPFLAGQEPVLASTRYCSNCGLQLYAGEP